MAVTRIGGATGTTTATVPAHAIGDLILIFAFRDGNTTAPSLPAGYTSIGTITGTTCSGRLGYKIATATNDASGTWTSATEVVCEVYRPTSGNTIAVGGSNSQAGTASSVTYPAVTMQVGTGSSWVAGFAGHRSLNTTLETAPTGMTNRDDVLDATAEAAGHDTNGGVSSWTSKSVAVGGTASGWVTFLAEIKDISPPTAGAWDKNRNTGTTLSGSDLIATTTAGNYAVSTESYGTGKHYAEVTLSGTIGNTTFVGVVDQALTFGFQALYGNDGSTGALGATLLTYASGDTICVALDADADLIWFRKNGGNWNNDAGANPATGANGLSIDSAVTWSLIFTPNNGGAGTGVATLNSGGSAFSQTKPTGFTNWNGLGGNAYTLSAAAGSFALTGTAATLKLGRRIAAAAGSFAVAGTDATLTKGKRLAAAAGSFAVTGSNAGTYLGRRTTAAAGSYAVTGSAAGLNKGKRLTADAGAFTVLGTDARTLQTRKLQAAAGSFSVAGTDARTLTGRKVQAAAGSFSIAGSAASGVLGHKLQAGAGSFALTGSSVNGLLGRRTTAAAGSFAYSGSTAGLLLKRVIAAGSGAFALTGTAATLTKSNAKTLVAGSGSFAVSGVDATFKSARRVSAVAGSFGLTGSSAALRVGRKATAGAGSFALNGNAAGLLRGLAVSAGTGAFSATGAAASLLAARRVAPIAGVFSITGQDAGLVIFGGLEFPTDTDFIGTVPALARSALADRVERQGIAPAQPLAVAVTGIDRDGIATRGARTSSAAQTNRRGET